ncbi:MAG TPA: hypothetical protein VG034_02610 [Acidimicrobiia bacterium]|jgi:hypothetical protein|nr:hypothetical protein [Acidimicrobiia bacterium]
MQIRTDRGWVKAGLAVLVTGSLGGGVVAATGIPSRGPKKVTADGVTGKAPLPPPPAEKGFDLAAAAPLSGEAAAKPDPVVGDKIKVGSDGGSVTVSAVEDNVSAGRLFGAGEGQKYIAVEVKGCSGPNEKNLTFEPAYFLLRLDDGTVHDPGPGAKKPSLEGGKMPTGKCLSGWVTYTVKEGSLASAVIYDGSTRLTWTVPLPKGAKPTTTTTLKAGVATASSTTTSTTSSKVKVSSTTTTTKRKTASGSTGTTSSTTGAKASSTTSTTTKPTTTSTSSPAKSSTTTTTRHTVVTTPTGDDG